MRLDLATISAIGIVIVHEVAHHIIGTTDIAIGTVGGVLVGFVLIGTLLNGEVVSRNRDVDGLSFVLLAAVSAGSTYWIHDYLHSQIGTSAEVIMTISAILAAVSFVGVALNTAGYAEGEQ